MLTLSIYSTAFRDYSKMTSLALLRLMYLSHKFTNPPFMLTCFDNFRCQTSRGVVGVVGVGVAHLSEATRERLAAASHHQQQHLTYVETPSMTSQHYIRQRRLSGRENPGTGYGQATFTPGIVEYSSLGKSKTNTETRGSTTAATSTSNFSSGFSTGPLGKNLLYVAVS